MAIARTEERRLVFGAGLLAVACGLFFTVGLGQPASRTRPVYLLVPVNGRWIESKPFVAGAQGRYRASVLFERKFQFEQMECLADVGMPFPNSTATGRRQDCAAVSKPTVLEWTVLENGRPMPVDRSFGDHAGEYSNLEVGRSLGEVSLRRFNTYAARLRMTSSGSAAAATEPKFQLQYEDIEGALFVALLFSVAALGLATIGLVVLLPALWRMRNRKHATVR